MRRLLLACVAVLLLPAAARATTYTVTNTNDSGAGSLRAALLAAGFGDVVAFAIPGAGVHEIAPVTALPPVAAGVTIDGFTQPGASCAAWPPTLLVELRGTQAPAATDGLTVSGDGVVILGLVVSGWPRNGITLAGASDGLLECNFVGTDASGTVDRGNGADGIRIVGGVGTVVRESLVSGNTLDGVRLDGAEGVELYANRIGPDATGATVFPNGGAGVELLQGAAGNIVGSLAEPNVIASNGGGGIVASGEATLGNDFLYNSLAQNGSVGIDLVGTLLENPNDPGDPDEGPNRLQNTPVPSLASYVEGTSTLTVRFGVSTDPVNATYPLTVAIYRADADQEEGEELLGVVQYGEADFATGVVERSFPVLGAVAPGDWIVGAARDADGNTSEYSPEPVLVTAPEPGALACGALALFAVAARRRAAR